MKKIVNFVLLLIIGVLLASCQSVPYSQRSQFLITSEAEEAQMGLEAWSEVLTTEKISNDAFLNSALQRVGQSIATVSGKKDFNWEFKVFESNIANAYCLPGGKVGVYTELYKYTGNDAELATVVSHEIAHAICRHGGERVTQGTIQNLGAAVLQEATDSEIAMLIYGVGTNLGAILPYSRSHELEADYVGLLLMAKAGYDPQQAIPFWEKFGDLDNSQFSEYFSTHPIGTNRITQLKEKMPEALNYYRQSQQKGKGNTYTRDNLAAAYKTYAQKTSK